MNYSLPCFVEMLFLQVSEMLRSESLPNHGMDFA
jgi:hypothetical protein